VSSTDNYHYPQEVPRPVYAIGAELVTDGFEQPPHRHRKAQLIMAVRGLVTCEVAKGLWMVPAQCALWIPGDMEHGVRGVGDVAVYMLFVEPEAVPAMFTECCTLSLSPLLRELIIGVSHMPPLYETEGADGRLAQTMLDQLVEAPVERLHLPLPSDPRLRRIADAFAADPADRTSIGEWAHRLAMSERSLFRLVHRDIGMSFVRWRQQCHIVFALKRLAEGEAVQAVAFALGYENASAFITMFKKVLGQPPARYLALRAGRHASVRTDD